MPAKGSRAFTSLTPEDQQAIANGVSAPNAGSWKNQWNTNDIDNEFSMMGPSQQATLLQTMNWHRQRVNQEQQQYNNNQKSKAAADAAKAAGKKSALNLSGGQASVPSVQQRMMSRMGQAVEKGVNKGKIKSSQLSQYQVPGQAAPANNGQAVNYTGQSSAAQKALKPVPMPRKTLAPPQVAPRTN